MIPIFTHRKFGLVFFFVSLLFYFIFLLIFFFVSRFLPKKNHTYDFESIKCETSLDVPLPSLEGLGSKRPGSTSPSSQYRLSAVRRRGTHRSTPHSGRWRGERVGVGAVGRRHRLLVAAARGARVQVDARGPGGAAVGALGGWPAVPPPRRAGHRLHRRGRRHPGPANGDHHILIQTATYLPRPYSTRPARPGPPTP